MTIKTGQKLRFEDLGVEVIVTVGGDADITANAAGPELLAVGKRYACGATGVQVLVTKAGAAALRCNGQLMELQEPKKTKAAD